MKYTIAIISACILMAACAHSKKVAYDFPASMSAAVRIKYTGTCDKGQILYNMNCSGCHNVKMKGHSKIPDFTQDQMSRYDLKVANNIQHDSSMVMTRVTPEELSEIYIFLTYKKKSNVPMTLAQHG